MSGFVHRFVKSMTMRERAYFRRFSKMYGQEDGKNYLLLFDKFLEQEQYDADSLKENFKNHSILKNWSSEINYLQGQILKSLTNYHLDSSKGMKLQKSILFVELLIERGFQKQGLKVLNKAKKIANQVEDFSTILKLIQLEEEILFKVGITGFTKQLSALQKERKAITHKIENLNQLRLLREQIRELQFSDMENLSKEDHHYYFQNDLIKEKNNAFSVKAMGHWLYIKSMQSYLLKDVKESQKTNLKTIQLMEANELIFKKSKLLIGISNYLYCSAKIGDEKGFEKMLEKLKCMESDPKLDKLHISFIRLARTLDLYHVTNDLKGTKKLIEEAVPLLKNERDRMGETQRNYLSILTLRGCFVLKEFEKGIEVLNDLMKSGIMDYLLIPSRFFLLMIYFELGWKEMISSEVMSAAKIFNRHKIQNDLTKTFLRFFKSGLKTPHRMNYHFEKLISKLEELKSGSNFYNEFLFFDYSEWAKQKEIENFSTKK